MLVKSKGVRGYWMLIVGLASALVFIGLVLGVYRYAGKHVGNEHVTAASSALVALGIVVFGLACNLIARRLDRPLDGSSDEALVKSYQTRFFLWVGFGEAPAFVGIIAFVVTGVLWLYAVGVLFAVLAYAHLAPTEAHLSADQAKLNHSGHGRSLRAALDTAPASPMR